MRIVWLSSGLRSSAGAVAFMNPGRGFGWRNQQARTRRIVSVSRDFSGRTMVRQDGTGGWETVVSGLVFPTALTLGPDGAFYVSECGYHCASGEGRILRVTVP
jgi:hypothetical protein